MLYTIGGSLGLLLAIQLIGVISGTFDIPKLVQTWPTLKADVMFGIPLETVKAVAFWAFVVAFAIKVPVWPFHTWLPDAHTEAPTAGSMILAGVLLKLGAYGFLRLVLPLFPAEAQQLCRLAGGVGHAGDHLWGIGRVCPDRFQAAGGLFLDQPYGFCGAGDCRGGLHGQALKTR